MIKKGGGGGGREREIFFFSFFPRPSPVYTDMRRLQGQTSDLCNWGMVVYYYQLNFHCSYHYLHCQHDYHCYNIQWTGCFIAGGVLFYLFLIIIIGIISPSWYLLSPITIVAVTMLTRFDYDLFGNLEFFLLWAVWPPNSSTLGTGSLGVKA